MKINLKNTIVIVLISLLSISITANTIDFDAQTRSGAPVGFLELDTSATTTTSLSVDYKIDNMVNVMDGTYGEIEYNPALIIYESGNTTPIQTMLLDDLDITINSREILGLNPSNSYTIGLSVPYDIDGNGIADNEAPYIITEISNALTATALPIANINKELSSSSLGQININFDFDNVNDVTTALYISLFDQSNTLVETQTVTIVEGQTNYDVVFNTGLNEHQIYKADITSDIDTNADNISDIDGVKLDSELFETDYMNTGPVGQVFDVDNGSSVTADSITVAYELIDAYQTIIDQGTLYPRVVISDETGQLINVERAEVVLDSGTPHTVIFNGLNPATNYQVNLTAQYDENKDGSVDNDDPFIVSNTVTFTTAV